MRLITIDNGNTNPHVGIFLNGKLEKIIPINEYTSLKNDFIIASDVGKPLLITPSFDLKSKRHTKASPYFFDMPVHYAETLGDDRLFAAYFAFKEIIASTQKTIVIDAGTFLTVDFVDQNGFMGGFIFPGLKTFLSSYTIGSKLPNLEIKDLNFIDQPKSTEEAILAAASMYLESVINHILKKSTLDKIILTGGESKYIQELLKRINSSIPIETIPHLIHESLALIHRLHLQSKAT